MNYDVYEIAENVPIYNYVGHFDEFHKEYDDKVTFHFYIENVIKVLHNPGGPIIVVMNEELHDRYIKILDVILKIFKETLLNVP